MNQNTHSVTLDAPAPDVFAFLADIRNLPRWAIHYARSVREVVGEFRVETPEGELVHRHAADPRTGVIDMWSGPDADHLDLFPTRVVPLPDGRSMFLFTALQHAGIDDATFARMCASIPEELDALRGQLAGSGRR